MQKGDKDVGDDSHDKKSIWYYIHIFVFLTSCRAQSICAYFHMQ